MRAKIMTTKGGTLECEIGEVGSELRHVDEAITEGHPLTTWYPSDDDRQPSKARRILRPQQVVWVETVAD